MYKIRVFDRVFCPDPHRPFGDFGNPLGQYAVPSGLRSGLCSALRATIRPPLLPLGTACCPRGFSKPPQGFGELGEISLPKTIIFYMNFATLDINPQYSLL